MRTELRLLSIFLLCVLVRGALVYLFGGPGLWGDAQADASFYPYRFLSGVPPKYFETHIISTSYFIGLYKLFGFSELTAQLGTILISSLSLTLFYRVFEIAFNRATANCFLGLSTITYMFLFYGIWPVCFALSAIGPALTLYFLVTAKTPPRMFVMGFFALLCMLIYPGAAICSLAVLLAYALIFWRELSRRNITFAGLGLFFSGLLLFAIRWKLDSRKLFEWGGGWLTHKDLFFNIQTIIEDIFVRSKSWDSYNAELPFIPVFALPLLLFATWLAVRRSNRWAQLLLLSAVFSVLIATPTGPYPGIRRCFPALFFLYGAIALGFSSLWSHQRWLAAVALLALAVTSASHTVWQISSNAFFRTMNFPDYAAIKKVTERYANEPTLIAHTVVLDLTNGTRNLFSETLSAQLGWNYIASGPAVYSAGYCPSFAELSSPVLVFSDLFAQGSDIVQKRIETCSKGHCKLSEAICPLDESQKIHFALANCSDSPVNTQRQLICPELGKS